MSVFEIIHAVIVLEILNRQYARVIFLSGCMVRGNTAGRSCSRSGLVCIEFSLKYFHQVTELLKNTPFTS